MHTSNKYNPIKSGRGVYYTRPYTPQEREAEMCQDITRYGDPDTWGESNRYYYHWLRYFPWNPRRTHYIRGIFGAFQKRSGAWASNRACGLARSNKKETRRAYRQLERRAIHRWGENGDYESDIEESIIYGCDYWD